MALTQNKSNNAYLKSSHKSDTNLEVKNRRKPHSKLDRYRSLFSRDIVLTSDLKKLN